MASFFMPSGCVTAGRQELFFCDFLLLVQKKVTKEKDSLGFSTTH
jgi:hypothetical protein